MKLFTKPALSKIGGCAAVLGAVRLLLLLLFSAGTFWLLLLLLSTAGAVSMLHDMLEAFNVASI